MINSPVTDNDIQSCTYSLWMRELLAFHRRHRLTAGIGEHSWRVREAVLKGMAWLGTHLEIEANRASGQIISARTSPTIVFVIPSDEERMIGESRSRPRTWR